MNATLDEIRARSKPEGECWAWTRATDKNGYPVCHLGRRTTSTRRVAYLLTRKRIRKGMLVSVCCHNRLCVNPAHLILQTRSQAQALSKEKARAIPRVSSVFEWGERMRSKT